MMGHLNIREADGKRQVFDPVRKKFVALTPEEWVRQHFLHYLIEEKKYSRTLIAIEAALQVNRLDKRSDIVVYSNTGKPVLVVECKAPGIKISQAVFEQVARYNLHYKVEYLVVTNGNECYCCRIDHAHSSYEFIEDVPDFEALQALQ